MELSQLSQGVLLAQQAAEPLSPNGKIALAVTIVIFLTLQFRRAVAIDLLFLGGLVLVTLAGVLDSEQALAGFSSRAVVMIAALFVGIGIWHHNSICAGRIIDDYAALTAQLRGELAKQTALARHEVKWADLPRISSRPIPVPEGHPEHDGGAA